MKHSQVAVRLLSYLWDKDRFDLKIRVIAAMTCLVLAKIANVIVPQFYSRAIDQLGVKEALVVPVLLIVSYGVVRVLSQAFGELRDFFFVRVSANAQRRSALETFEHLHNLSLRFHLDRQTGGLSRVIERGVAAIQFVLSFMLFNIVPTLLEILLVVGILLYSFSWPFAVITFVCVFGYIIFSVMVTEWRLKFRRRMNDSDSKANTKAIDSLINYETVKYFCNEGHEKNRYNSSLVKYEEASIQSQGSLSLLNIGQGLIIGVGLTSVMLLAGYEVKDETMTVGDFVLVQTYLLQLYMPLNFMGFVYRQIKQSFVDMEQMYSLLGENQEVKDQDNAPDIEVSGGVLEFKNVSFAYNADRPILKNVSFKIESGQTLAVVGPSGSGKSTLARLLYRFYDIQEGEISIDGQNIQSVGQKSLRQSIGIVPQDTVLFNDSIAYNIEYGMIGSSFEKVQEAAKLSRIDGFIEGLPQKYETSVGERGLKLSGGEKQRVAIARTFLKNPPILILDEATSALDSKTESAIQESISEVSQKRTTLVIAHRLSTIVDADQIVVLKDGEILEMGQHNDLLHKKGEYWRMWELQKEH